MPSSADCCLSWTRDPFRLPCAPADAGELTALAALTFGSLVVFLPPADPEVAAALREVPGPAAELSKCYVHPSAHGTGIAAALMQAARDTAAGEGCRSLWLGVNDLNVRARAFYRKSGFEEVGRRSFAVGPHVFRDFILAAPLAGTTSRE